MRSFVTVRNKVANMLSKQDQDQSVLSQILQVPMSHDRLFVLNYNTGVCKGTASSCQHFLVKTFSGENCRDFVSFNWKKIFLMISKSQAFQIKTSVFMLMVFKMPHTDKRPR